MLEAAEALFMLIIIKSYLHIQWILWNESNKLFSVWGVCGVIIIMSKYGQ